MWCPFLVIAICCPLPEEHAPAIAERSEEARLNGLLNDWEIQSQKGKVIQIEFSQYVYDTVFKVEKQSTGCLILGDGQYRADVTPVTYTKDDKSQRDGYKLRRGPHETWIGGSGRTTQHNHEAKQIDIFIWIRPSVRQEPPKPDRGTEFFLNWIPADFLGTTVPSYIRVRAEDLKQRFDVSLVDDAEDKSVFELTPKGKPESLQWSSIRVMWSHKKRRVHAVQFIDPGRVKETVYVVKDYLVDPALDLEAVMNPTYPDYDVKEHSTK